MNEREPVSIYCLISEVWFPFLLVEKGVSGCATYCICTVFD